jgi:hypothetical protein
LLDVAESKPITGALGYAQEFIPIGRTSCSENKAYYTATRRDGGMMSFIIRDGGVWECTDRPTEQAIRVVPDGGTSAPDTR